MTSTTPTTHTAPLYAVLAFTALNSFAAGTTSTGIFFVTRNAYEFSATANYGLGLLFGVGYTIGALGSAPALRRVRSAFPMLSSRALLALVVGALSLLCALPVLVPSPRTIWAMLGVYAAICGTLWPIVQTYLSGGRAASDLQRAVGVFNLTWSSTLVASFWLIAPVLKSHPLGVLGGVALVHLASFAFLPALGREPGITPPVTEHAPTVVSKASLAAHRVLLASAYLVMYALIPFLPTLLDDIGVARVWQTPLTSLWLITRVVTFYALLRSPRWRGRDWPAVIGMACVVTGFALTVLASAWLSHGVAIAQFALGLVAFGIGVAVLYFAALFYALEAGRAKVDAGGRHEAMIGAGYTLGPLCGLVAYEAAALGWIAPTTADPLMLVAVFGFTVLGIVTALRVARR